MKHTPEQSAIIAEMAEGRSHLMIDAVAGAAKTTTIVAGAPGIKGRALAVAFNKKIAEELKLKLPMNFECKTLNGLGHTAWVSAIRPRIALDADKIVKLVDAAYPLPKGSEWSDEALELNQSTTALVRRARHTGLVPKTNPIGQGLIPDNLESWEQVAEEADVDLSEELLARARRILSESIKQAYAGVIDFDDQIYMSALFGGQFPQFDTVIVDEAQDLSPLNHTQLQKVIGKKGRLIAVGDPNQAIYAFRGADRNSMTNLRDAVGGMEVMRLTNSFRCAKAVALRQVSHVPHFKAFETNNEGKVLDWQGTGWSLENLPNEGAIICRNNAPLIKLAFALIRAKRPVKIMGRDIGANLANTLKKITKKQNLPSEVALRMIVEWVAQEQAKAKTETKKELIADRAECLTVLIEASEAETSAQAEQFIKDLFSEAKTSLTLTSGHRSKGLEWDWVMHLDPDRCPSHFARKQARNGNYGPLQQEQNLRYVIETRTKNVLVEANLEECIDIPQVGKAA